MDVYLIPVGAERYEPYCEVADHWEAGEDEPLPRGGWVARLQKAFHDMVAAAERERAGRADAPGRPGGLVGRARLRVLRWVAERIAEQRLLWHLRRQDAAVLVHPADIDAERALDVLMQALRRDGDRHRLWLVVDGLLLAISSVLTVIPGPNIIWWYFAFRVVGHYLSWRGASCGRHRVTWRCRPSGDLVELRRAIALAPGERERHVGDIASRLQLQHLARFFERITPRTA